MSEFWNSRFSGEEYFYGTEPNEFFRQQISKLPVGRLWVPGAGEGRDAVYAATLGWQVDAFDASSAGRDKGLKLAHDRNVNINYLVADAAEIEPGDNQYDAIALVFFHLPPPLKQTFLHKCVKALKPGGTLIIEKFEPRQLSNNSGGPKDIDMLYTKQLFATELGELTSIINEETTTELNEGPHHSGVANVARFVGVK